VVAVSLAIDFKSGKLLWKTSLKDEILKIRYSDLEMDDMEVFNEKVIICYRYHLFQLELADGKFINHVKKKFMFESINVRMNYLMCSDYEGLTIIYDFNLKRFKGSPGGLQKEFIAMLTNMVECDNGFAILHGKTVFICDPLFLVVRQFSLPGEIYYNDFRYHNGLFYIISTSPNNDDDHIQSVFVYNPFGMLVTTYYFPSAIYGLYIWNDYILIPCGDNFVYVYKNGVMIRKIKKNFYVFITFDDKLYLQVETKKNIKFFVLNEYYGSVDLLTRKQKKKVCKWNMSWRNAGIHKDMALLISRALLV